MASTKTNSKLFRTCGAHVRLGAERNGSRPSISSSERRSMEICDGSRTTSDCLSNRSTGTFDRTQIDFSSFAVSHARTAFCCPDPSPICGDLQPLSHIFRNTKIIIIIMIIAIISMQHRQQTCANMFEPEPGGMCAVRICVCVCFLFSFSCAPDRHIYSFVHGFDSLGVVTFQYVD